MPGVYLKQGDSFIAMRETSYDAEKILQDLVAAHPQLLAGNEVDGRAPWLLIKQEASIVDGPDGAERWWLDHLFVDSSGVPTLVEVKRSSDSRIRREVVGQMFDYAANVVHWPPDTLRSWFETQCVERGEDPADALASVLEGQHDPEEFWERVRSNLAAGKLRLVFVADEIPRELAGVVEFLNGQMQETEVLAIEVKQYVDDEGNHQTIVPRVLGQTEAARHAKGQAQPVRRPWNRQATLDHLTATQGAASASVARQILDWSESHGDLTVHFGSGRVDGSFQPGRYGERYLFPFTVYTYGTVEINFQYLARSSLGSHG